MTTTGLLVPLIEYFDRIAIILAFSIVGPLLMAGWLAFALWVAWRRGKH